MSEVPDEALLWLDEDVATWLHLEADRHYAGDVGRAMNETLRALMSVAEAPHDPWAVPQARLRARQRR